MLHDGLNAQQDYWVEERPSYYIQTGSAFRNPYGVPWRELGRTILEQPAAMVAQVVFGKVVPDDGAVFGFELIQGLFRGFEGQAINSTVWLDEEAAETARLIKLHQKGLGRPSFPRYAAGADLARKKDATVIFVLDTDPVRRGEPARVVYYRRVERVPWASIYAEIGKASWLFDCEVLLDSTGAGDVVADEVESRTYCPKHHVTNEINQHCVDHRGDFRDCDPTAYHTIQSDRYHFSESTKVKLITNLAQCLGEGFDPNQPEKEYGLLRSPRIPKLQEQMGLYKFQDKKLETDEVMGLSLAAWAGLRDYTGPAYVGSTTG